MATEATVAPARGASFNVSADIRDNGSTMLIVVDLTGPSRVSATGRSDVLAGTGFPVRIEHPELGSIWYSVTVGKDAPDYAALKAEKRALAERMKAYKAKTSTKTSTK